jgi:uncharacterized protein (DUF488 family)
MSEFIDKLKEYRIGLVVDVRSRPFSRYHPHFCRKNLETTLPSHDIGYLFRGANLGGMEENVGYELAIKEVLELSQSVRLALMCSEGDFTQCHRYTMLTPDLEALGVNVEHIAWPVRSKQNPKSMQVRLP